LILRIIKIAATRCQILGLKCTKFDFGWASAPDPAGEAYGASPAPLVGFKGATSMGEKGRERGSERGGKGRRGEGKSASHYKFLDAPLVRRPVFDR